MKLAVGLMTFAASGFAVHAAKVLPPSFFQAETPAVASPAVEKTEAPEVGTASSAPAASTERSDVHAPSPALRVSSAKLPNASRSSVQSLGLSLRGRVALMGLLQDSAGTAAFYAAKGGTPVPLATYLPGCERHLVSLFEELADEHTAVQLTTVLSDACTRSSSFPLVYGRGWHAVNATAWCLDFSGKLADLRMSQLQHAGARGDSESVQMFCEEYYQHAVAPGEIAIAPVPGTARRAVITAYAALLAAAVAFHGE